jgi:Arc/MetJ family transcription regulator
MGKVEIEIDAGLVQEAIRRYHLADTREAVNLALRTLLLGEPTGSEAGQPEDEYDEFSDPNAWQPHRNGDGR